MCVAAARAFAIDSMRVVGGEPIARPETAVEEIATWQARPLEPVYPLVFFDALRVKVRDEGTVRNKAVHIALGVRADGAKEILGLWLEQSEGAKFWLRVLRLAWQLAGLAVAAGLDRFE